MGSCSSHVLTECSYLQEKGSFSVHGFEKSTLAEILATVRVLEKLNVSSVVADQGDLSCFPAEVVVWTSLQKLCLGGNLLSELPDHFFNPSFKYALTELFLDSNLFDAPPRLVSSILKLSMANNRLSSCDFATAAALTSLDLERNLLSDVTDLSKLVALEELKLGTNLIKTIPDAFSRLSRLHTLSLRNNPIDNVSALSSLVSLRFLNLNDCRLDRVDPLSTLTDLRVLALQHNHITEFCQPFFSGMSQLQTLAVNDNMLLSLPTSISSLVSLQRLFAHENLLVTLPSELGSCVELTTLRLEYNEVRRKLDSFI